MQKVWNKRGTDKIEFIKKKSPEIWTSEYATDDLIDR